MKKVEQVDIDGNIVIDYDNKLPPSKLYERIQENFPNIYKNENEMICGEYKGIRYALRVKNITYLGNPHPLYKKRIQISDDLQKFYANAIQKQYIPILLGVYTYNDNTVFCEFNINDFVGKKTNNSSAHVFTENLSDATVDGFFQKEDNFGNRITVFSKDNIYTFLEDKLVSTTEKQLDKQKYDLDNNFVDLEIAESDLNTRNSMPVLIKKTISDFFANENKYWNGIECYKKMIQANYRNKYQAEWPGYYYEFEFEKYLKERKLTSVIRYKQDKTKGGIDLDLYFPTIDMYGDLKAHSSNKKGIQGNDWRTIFNILDSASRDNHIYYIVCEHDTFKDSQFNYEVTHFWNNVQGKENIMSYSAKMKNNVELTKAYILDINARNKNYLSKFKQGINSNGKPREPKIMIDYDNLTKFIISESRL